MTRPSATNSVWKLDGTTAHFDDGRLEARIDLLQPQLGLCRLVCSGQTLPTDSSALGVDLGPVTADDLSLPETYARVDDLVATYLQTESRPFRLQAYWRRVDLSSLPGCQQATAIELQLSINTSLLDTHPSIAVESRMAGEKELPAANRPYGITRTKSGLIYFEAVHPGDERAAAVRPTSPVAPSDASRHVFFGDFLEKGVIVRARIRAAFLPAAASLSALAAIYESFTSEPLPLTT